MKTIDADVFETGMKAIEASIDMILWAFSHGYLTSEDAGILVGASSPCQGDITPVSDRPEVAKRISGVAEFLRAKSEHLQHEHLPALGWERPPIGEQRSLLGLLNHLTIADRSLRQLWVD